MRVAAFVIGLVASLLMLFESLLAGCVGTLTAAFGEEETGVNITAGEQNYTFRNTCPDCVLCREVIGGGIRYGGK